MNCLGCGVKFDGFKSKLYRIELCKNCYQKQYYDKIKRKEKPTNCASCNKVLKTSSGQSNFGNGQCRNCYNRNYMKNVKKCPGCQSDNRSNFRYCKLCRKAGSGSFTIMPEWKRGVNRPLLEEIRLLLARYKNGFNSPVDDYRTVDLYLRIFIWDAQIDCYAADKQVVYMLRVLKNLYDTECNALTLQTG